MAGAFGGDYEDEQLPDEEELNDEESEAEEEELEEEAEQQLQEYAKKRAKENLEKKAKQKVSKSAAKKVVMSVLKMLAPALPYIAIALLVIIVVAAAWYAIETMLNPFGAGGMSSVNGIKGERFYGARLIYKDELQAQADILENYVNLIGGATANVKLEDGEVAINLTLPENFNYRNFNETTFPLENADLFAILSEMATTAYSADNGAQPAELTFAEIIYGIKYFGIEADWNFAEIISSYVNENNLYTYTAGSSTLDENAIESEISADISNYFSTISTIRTEKLYIEDRILAGADDMLENIEKKQYVSLIFMPKSDVTFTQHSLVVAGANYDVFSATLVNGTSKVTLDKYFFLFDDDGGNNCYAYKANLLATLNEKTTAFNDIDKNNLRALSAGKSLMQIVEELDENIYLQTITTESGKQVYAPKMNGVHINFYGNQIFKFAEEVTKVK